jgi:hypothetical protein
MDVSAVRDVPAPAAMHAAAVARVAASVAASSANLNDRTVIRLRGGGARSVQFDCFRLGGCETQQRRDRDPSGDRSGSLHGVTPLRGALKMAAFCDMDPCPSFSTQGIRVDRRRRTARRGAAAI